MKSLRSKRREASINKVARQLEQLYDKLPGAYQKPELAQRLLEAEAQFAQNLDKAKSAMDFSVAESKCIRAFQEVFREGSEVRSGRAKDRKKSGGRRRSSDLEVGRSYYPNPENDNMPGLRDREQRRFRVDADRTDRMRFHGVHPHRQGGPDRSEGD